MKHARLITLVFALCSSSQAFADDVPATAMQHKPGMQHGAMGMDNLPTESGQSAFAAIQEIVAKLEADPTTDWSKINIEALRLHLVDMDAVTLQAAVMVEPLADARKFIVSGEAPVVSSIQRMLTGHATTMNGKDGWLFTAETNATGAALVVKPPNADEMVKLDGLGFIGIMTMGMHHQEHHWNIAKGGQPHHN